jgi:hypothetical protein
MKKEQTKGGKEGGKTRRRYKRGTLMTCEGGEVVSKF